MHRATIPALAFLVLSSGCAAIMPNVTYQTFGAANPERDEAVVKRWESLYDRLPTSHVKVLISTIPEGIEVKDGVVTTKPGYSHVVISKFKLDAMGGFGLLWFWSYRSPTTSLLCHWQVPLTWLTMTIWSYLPLAWGCHPVMIHTKRQIIRDAKKLAAAAGGDLILAQYLGDRGSGKVFGLTGVIVRMDPRFRGKQLKTTPAPAPSAPRSSPFSF